MVTIGDYVQAPDTRAAEWVVDGLHGFAESVVSVVPAGFAAYARIFHSARLQPTSWCGRAIPTRGVQAAGWTRPAWLPIVWA